MKVKDIIGDNGSAQHLIVKLINKPSKSAPLLIVESAFISESGAEKSWGKGYSYRLDRRGPHHGGDQIHISRKHDAWAYRQVGTRSEPTKYTTPAKTEVKDIVRSIFKLAPNFIVEAHVVSASSEGIILEVSFC